MVQLLLVATHGKDDSEQARTPFVIAATARSMDIRARVLQPSGVMLAKGGFAETMRGPGPPSLAELLTEFLRVEGDLMICGGSAWRGLDPNEMIPRRTHSQFCRYRGRDGGSHERDRIPIQL